MQFSIDFHWRYLLLIVANTKYAWCWALLPENSLSIRSFCMYAWWCTICGTLPQSVVSNFHLTDIILHHPCSDECLCFVWRTWPPSQQNMSTMTRFARWSLYIRPPIVAAFENIYLCSFAWLWCTVHINTLIAFTGHLILCQSWFAFASAHHILLFVN